MEGLAKVPTELAKDNFYIQFALKDGATHGKVYREINALEHQVTMIHSYQISQSIKKLKSYYMDCK